MQPWTWLAAYVVGFGLLQVLLYRRFRQQTPTSNGAAGPTDPQGGSRLASTGPDATTACRHCETVNEHHSMVRYCRTCAEPLR